MNKKERILAAINFKEVDRIPSTFRSIGVFAGKQNVLKIRSSITKHCKCIFIISAKKIKDI